MDAIQNLIDELSQSQNDVDLISALWRTKDAANIHHSPGLDELINSELNGYTECQEIPWYRLFGAADCDNYGEYSGPGDATATRYISIDDLPEDVKEFAENLVLRDGVEVLRDLGAEPYKKPWPIDLVMSVKDHPALKEDDLYLIGAYQSIREEAHQRILYQVKNRLIELLMEIKNNSPTEEESNEAQAIGGNVTINNYNTEVHADNANVNIDGEQHVDQQVITVQKGDLDSLLTYLRGVGIEDDDLQELRDAITSEPEALPDGSYGAKVQGWLENMRDKVSKGLGNVGREFVTEVLPKALHSFFFGV